MVAALETNVFKHKVLPHIHMRWLVCVLVVLSYLSQTEGVMYKGVYPCDSACGRDPLNQRLCKVGCDSSSCTASFVCEAGKPPRFCNSEDSTGTTCICHTDLVFEPGVNPQGMLFSESVPAFSNYCAGNEYNNCFYVNPWEDWKTKGWCKRDLSRGVTYDPFGHCDGRGYTSENIEANFTDCEDYIVDKFGFGGERLFGQNVQLEFMSEQLVEGLTIHMLPDIDLRWSEGLSILLHFDPAMENSLLVTETPLCDQIKHYIDKKTTTLIPLSGRTGDRGLPSKLVIPVTFEAPMYLRSLTLFTASGVVPVRKVEVMTSPQKEVCMKCPRNHYCVNGAQYQCPPNSYLKRGGAFQKSECRCKQGFTRNFFLTSITCSEYDGSRGCWLSDENDDWPCIPCPEGRYCPMEPSGNSAIYDLSSECEVQCGDNEVSMCKFGPSTPCTPKSKIPPPSTPLLH